MTDQDRDELIKILKHIDRNVGFMSNVLLFLVISAMLFVGGSILLALATMGAG